MPNVSVLRMQCRKYRRHRHVPPVQDTPHFAIAPSDRLVQEAFDERGIVGQTALRPAAETPVGGGTDESEEPILLALHTNRVGVMVQHLVEGHGIVLPEVEELLESTHHHPPLMVEEQATGLRRVFVPPVIDEGVTGEVAGVHIRFAIDRTDAHVRVGPHAVKQITVVHVIPLG